MRRTLIGALLAALVLCLVAATHNPGTFVGGSGGASYIPSVLFPDTLKIAVGREGNIWYDAMSPYFYPGLATSWLAYGTLTDTTVARALDRCWRWSPSAAKSETITVKTVDPNGAIGQSATMIVRAVSKTAGSGTNRILFIGDSLLDGTAADTTSSSPVISLVDSLFNVIDAGAGTLVTVGTQGTTWKGEGRAGYTAHRFSSAPSSGIYSPFWDSTHGRVDFRDYMTRHSLTGPIDYCVIMLGWNDIFALGGTDATVAQIDHIVAHIDTLVSVMKDEYRGYPGCRVFVCTNPMGANTLAGWGREMAVAGYKTYRDDWTYWQRNMARLNAAIIARFDDDGTYADTKNQVDVIPVHLAVDRKYGYSFANLAVSARNPNTEFRHTAWIHPNASGADQEADIMYGYLRHGFAMGNPVNLLSNTEQYGTWVATGSPSWVGWAPCTVADVDSAAGQVWSFTDNTLTYFTLATPGLTIGESNCLSFYFKRQGSGYSTSPMVLVDVTGGTDRYATFSVTDTYPTGMLSLFNTFFGGSNYGGANADSSYNWHRTTNTPSGWLRISFSFDHMLNETTNQQGLAIAGVRLYVNGHTSRTSSQISLTGIQFEQGTRRPSKYCPNW